MENMSESLIDILLKSGISYNDIISIDKEFRENGYLYIDINNHMKNNISYLPEDKKYLVSNKWSNNYRVVTRIGRLFTKNDIDITENEILTFNSLTNKLFKKYYFEIVKGEDIRKYYHQDNYKKGGGPLNNSCMRHEDCQFKFDIYVNNPLVCKLLIMMDNKNDDKIIGRALLWETNRGKFMDRIYPLEHNNIYDFFNYAEENGYIYKDVNGRYKKNNTYITKPKLTVNLYDDNNTVIHKFFNLFKRKKNINRENYPYFDTLRYFNYKRNTLSNSISYDFTIVLDMI